MKLADGASEGRYSIARRTWSGGGKTAAPCDFLRKSGNSHATHIHTRVNFSAWQTIVFGACWSG